LGWAPSRRSRLRRSGHRPSCSCTGGGCTGSGG
jgi:hypothetical protein